MMMEMMTTMTMMRMRMMKRKKRRKKKKVGNQKRIMMGLSVLIFHLVMILTVLFHAEEGVIVSHQVQNHTKAKTEENPVENQENIRFLIYDNPLFTLLPKQSTTS